MLLQNFLAGVDESWFRLVHVDIEARAAPAVAALHPLIHAAHQVRAVIFFVAFPASPSARVCLSARVSVIQLAAHGSLGSHAEHQTHLVLPALMHEAGYLIAPVLVLFVQGDEMDVARGLLQIVSSLEAMQATLARME
jgi:hypothetical protein